jgi:sugar-specific transcriptional regulator TrmB
MSKNIDKAENRDLTQKLEHLGLTEKESRVYLALLPRHDTGTSNLIRATGLHGQFVYAALDRLEQLGLAQHVIQNGRKKFSANAPQRIVSLADEKKIVAQSIVRELQKRFTGTPEQSFEVYQGESALVGHELAMLERVPEGSRIDVITGLGEEYLSTIGLDVDEFEKIRLERKVEIRVISTEKRTKVFEKMSKERKLWSWRIFPGLGTGVVDIGIWHDAIIYNVFGNSILSFTLTSKTVADGYREFFEALWNVSSK